MATLQLYDHPVSSYAQKVRITLREKGSKFETTVPAMGVKESPTDVNFKEANPRLQVPALITEEGAIFDSTIICEYLEEKYPEPRLAPENAFKRAQSRMIEDVCDTSYEALNWAFGEILWFKRATGELADKLRAEAISQTKIIHKWLESQLGSDEYFSGATFGSADIAVAPLLNRSRFYGIGPDPDSPLSAWLERIEQRPSVKETFAEFDAGVSLMSGATGAFAPGGPRRREYRDHRLEWLIKSGGLEVVLAGIKEDTIRFGWPEAGQA